MKFLTVLLLAGCASVFDAPPYWKQNGPRCTAQPTVTRAATLAQLQKWCPTQINETGACIDIGDQVCDIHLGPKASGCELGHELKHAQGFTHGPEPLQKQNCGDSASIAAPNSSNLT